MSVPVAYVVRSGLVEGAHFGSAVVVDAQGKVEWSIGDVSTAMFPRSSSKLMQGLAMVRNGLPLKNELLALACASHSGEDFHLAGVQDILNAANLDTSALQCPADWPLDEIERDTLLAAGLGKSSSYMNCSGKHSAMLFTCVLNGWDTDTYLKPTHPLQLAWYVDSPHQVTEAKSSARIGSIQRRTHFPHHQATENDKNLQKQK